MATRLAAAAGRRRRWPAVPRHRAIAAAAVTALAGCAAAPWAVPVETQPRSNPFLLPVAVSPRASERTWERCVDVLHQYKFRIARENRPAGTIETEYKVGSGLLEPWHHDSVGAAARLESTLQSIRRRVIVRVLPDESEAGYLIGVEAFKEREDLAGEAATDPGGATFNEYVGEGVGDLGDAIGTAGQSGWFPLGRDAVLEADLLQSLQIALTR